MRKIRKYVFETNSSSTHSITICTQADYTDWITGKSYFISNMGFYNKTKEANDYLRTLQEKSNFATADEIEHLFSLDPSMSNDYLTAKENNELSEMLATGYYCYSSEAWDNYVSWDCNFEDYEKRFTTPSGDKMVAFGYYGSDN